MWRIFRRSRSPRRRSLPSRIDVEIREEIRFYLEMRAEELRRAGLPPEEAWRTAIEAFGDPEAVVETVVAQDPDGRRGPLAFLDGVAQDARLGLRHLRRMPPILAWLGLALAGAFGLAVGVNALRIAASMWLYQADIYTGWLTPARVHRLAGVCLYLCALGLFFKGLQPIIARYSRRFDPLEKGAGRPWPAWLPLGWYLLGAVGVPAADLVFRRPAAGFGEHCLTVVVAALVVWGGAGGIRRLAATTGHRRPTASRDREQEICRPKY